MNLVQCLYWENPVFSFGVSEVRSTEVATEIGSLLALLLQ